MAPSLCHGVTALPSFFAYLPFWSPPFLEFFLDTLGIGAPYRNNRKHHASGLLKNLATPTYAFPMVKKSGPVLPIMGHSLGKIRDSFRRNIDCSRNKRQF
jgi:hypothetical protein